MPTVPSWRVVPDGQPPAPDTPPPPLESWQLVPPGQPPAPTFPPPDLTSGDAPKLHALSERSESSKSAEPAQSLAEQEADGDEHPEEVDGHEHPDSVRRISIAYAEVETECRGEEETPASLRSEGSREQALAANVSSGGAALAVSDGSPLSLEEMQAVAIERAKTLAEEQIRKVLPKTSATRLHPAAFLSSSCFVASCGVSRLTQPSPRLSGRRSKRQPCRWNSHACQRPRQACPCPSR